MPPESTPSEPEEPNVETDETEQLIAERTEESRVRFADLYDQAILRGTDPRQTFLDESASQAAREIFGDDRVDAFRTVVQALTWETREEFIDRMLELAKPFHRARYADPEIRARADARHEREEQLDAGLVQLKLRRSEDDVLLRDGTHIEPGSIVVELSVAERKEGLGLRGLQQSLHTIAEYVKAHPDVVAVTGVSWMMKRRLVERLGFEVIEHVGISPGQKEKIASTARTARKEKDYDREIEADDVAYGAMSRADFLQRYGSSGEATESEKANSDA